MINIRKRAAVLVTLLVWIVCIILWALIERAKQ